MSVSVSQFQLVDPTNATDPHDVESAVVETRTLAMRAGNINGKQYAWTRLSNAQPGDIIWINVTTDGGKTWSSVGRRTIQAGGRNYTDALATSSSEQIKMQAWTQLANGHKYNTASW